MVKLYSEVFDNASVGPDDDFFDLGGDSLLAEALMTAVEKAFGIRLSASLLLEAPSPRRLLETLALNERPGNASCLIVVRAGGSDIPLFCVHGANGQPIFPRRLADRLAPGRPVYALRARGVQSGEVPHASVEEMAREFVREIRTRQPAGPYLILGQCDPAVIALEMAQQLVAAGERVAGLILTDPQMEHRAAPWLSEGGLSLMLIQKKLAKRAQDIAKGMRDRSKFPEKDRIPLVENVLVDAAAAYTPKAYGGPALMICSAERKPVLLNPARGFQTRLTRMEAVETGDRHESVFQDRIAGTAAAIQSFIERVTHA